MTKVNTFLDSLKSEQTKSQYSYHLERFNKYNRHRSLLQLRNPSQTVIEYLVSMRKEHLSYSYRSLSLSTIKHYYEMNDVLLNWKKIRKFLAEKTSDNKLRAYTHEEIQKLLSVADPTYAAIILTYCSTGMRRAALTDIKLTDMEFLPEYKIYKIKLYRQTENEYTCFTTPEAASAIDLYIRTEQPQKYLHRIEPKSISMHLRKLSLKAGIGIISDNLRKAGQYRDVIPSVHGLRKFAITQMKRAKVDTEISKLLTDHSIGIRAKYVELSDEDLLKEYILALDNLTINQENRLKLKVAEQEQTINQKLSQKDEEVKRLQKGQEQLMQLLRRQVAMGKKDQGDVEGFKATDLFKKGEELLAEDDDQEITR